LRPEHLGWCVVGESRMFLGAETRGVQDTVFPWALIQLGDGARVLGFRVVLLADVVFAVFCSAVFSVGFDGLVVFIVWKADQ
jgi:hypothetical protein